MVAVGTISIIVVTIWHTIILIDILIPTESSFTISIIVLVFFSVIEFLGSGVGK